VGVAVSVDESAWELRRSQHSSTRNSKLYIHNL
jgi:hypothetical protein